MQKRKNLKSFKIYIPYIKGFWIVFLVSVSFVFLVFLAASIELFGALPNFEDFGESRKKLCYRNYNH